MGKVVLVRHGQASFGQADYDRLSGLGHEQARATGRALAERGVTPDLLVTGQMRRHRQTLDALVEGAGWESDVDVRTDAGWDEIDHLGVMPAYGVQDAGGYTDAREFQVAYERSLRAWMLEEVARGGLESWPGFVGRITDSLERAGGEAGPGRTVVVVTSAGPVGVGCASLMHEGFPHSNADAWMRWNAVVVNCSLTTVISGRQGVRLLAFNEHQHLEPEQVTYR